MKNTEILPYYPALMRMEAMSPGSGDEEQNSSERNLHRDDAETIDKLTKERFRLQLRIYHMEEHMKQTHGSDWKSSMNQKIELEECRVELEDKLKLLTQSAKMIDQLKIQLEAAKKEKSKLVKEKDEALRDVSNVESKWRRTEDENSRLRDQLSSARDSNRRSRERISLDYEETETRLRESETRLAESQRENERLHGKLGDLQNNNNTIDQELNRKYDEVNALKDENDELLEEVERLRDELEKNHAEKEKHRRRKYNSFEVGVQCETRMCEKAVQTKVVPPNQQHPPSRSTSRLPRPMSNSQSIPNLRRTSSVDNLAPRQHSAPHKYHQGREMGRYRPSYGSAVQYNETPTRYQTLVQSQSRDLALLRKQLEQSRMTTHKLRNIIEDLTRSDQVVDQRRYIQLARRTIRKLEGELEDRGESATSECNSDSDYEKEENHHIKSRILPAVLEIKNMVNELREKQNDRDTGSIRSNYSNSSLSLNNLNQKVQETKRLSRNIQDAFEVDSGKAMSPLDLNSLNGLHDSQLLPGLVQELQSLRLKFDTSVKRNEKLSEQYLEKLEKERNRTVSLAKPMTREFATQSDLAGTTIATYEEEIGALRSFLSSKDDEIFRLTKLNMPKPIFQSSPDESKSKTKKFKAPPIIESNLTPPTSDHQSGGEETVSDSRIGMRSLSDRLTKTRQIAISLTHRLESKYDNSAGDSATYDLRQVINSLDDMHKIMYKLENLKDVESSRNENTRLKQKVTTLETMLSRSCERLRSANALKHGVEYQMTTQRGNKNQMSGAVLRKKFNVLSKAANFLSSTRTHLGTTTPSTSRATSLNGDLESC